MVKKRLVEFGVADLRVPLAEGETVPCPKCANSHVVLRDQRDGTRIDAMTGSVSAIRNTALYVDCPYALGPIIVGISGFALPEPLELTPRRKR
jgi:hypothetical protein